MASTTIKNFEILNNGQQLSINLESVAGSLITSVELWNIDTFKNSSLSVSLTYKLTQLSNTEVFTVTAAEVGVTSFTDIWFIEIKNDYTGSVGCTNCQEPALGITYNLQTYYKCMLNYLLESEKSMDCSSTNVYSNNLTITVSLMIDAIEKSLGIGYYSQAIEMINNLKKLCNISKCKNCKTITCVSCSKFIQP